MNEFMIWEHDKYGYWTGRQKMTSPQQGIPRRWTRVVLPEIPTGKFARLNGDHWKIEDERPTIRIVPQSVTPRQARRALENEGLLSAVEGALQNLDEPQRTQAQIDWEYAISIERYSPLTIQLAALLGLTEEQIDDLFVAAAGE